jgi:hypothetical protein
MHLMVQRSVGGSGHESRVKVYRLLRAENPGRQYRVVEILNKGTCPQQCHLIELVPQSSQVWRSH